MSLSIFCIFSLLDNIFLFVLTTGSRTEFCSSTRKLSEGSHGQSWCLCHHSGLHITAFDDHKRQCRLRIPVTGGEHIRLRITCFCTFVRQLSHSPTHDIPRSRVSTDTEAREKISCVCSLEPFAIAFRAVQLRMHKFSLQVVKVSLHDLVS